MNYIPKTPPDTSAAPCYPEQKALACNLCTRWRSAAPIPAEKRQFVIIDASLFIVDGVCPMYEARPSVHPHAEPVEREAIAPLSPTLSPAIAQPEVVA